jgi:hypothetical protein
MPPQFIENIGISYVLGSIYWRARIHCGYCDFGVCVLCFRDVPLAFE